MKRLVLVTLICLLLIVPISAYSCGPGGYSVIVNGVNATCGYTIYEGDAIQGLPCAGCGNFVQWQRDSDAMRGLSFSNPYTVETGYTDPWLVYATSWPGLFYYNWVHTPRPTPVHADFTGTPLSGSSPLTIQFTDASTGNPSPSSWYWEITNNFDSEVLTDTAQNASFTIYDAGVYTASLTVSNGTGSDTETKTDYFTVGTQYTQIFRAFDRSSSLSIPGVLITISDGQTGTTDANGRVTLTMWNGNRTASGSKTGYSSPGPVVFTANSNGQIVNVPMDYTGTVTPTPTPTVAPTGAPTAHFTYGGNIGALPRTVTLTSTSTGSPTLYSWWYYPPGSVSPFAMSSTTSSATFDALVEGVYSAFLYVENADGSDSYSTVIIVQSTATPTVTVTPTPTPTPTVTPVPAGGGNITWDKSKYVAEEIALISYEVDSYLWIPSSYNYNVKVVNDGGTTIATLPIDKSITANRIGNKSVTLTAATYPTRRYYAVLEMISVTDSGVITLADDYMDLEGYVLLSGYVLDGDTALPLSGVDISVIQQTRADAPVTDSTGYWSSSNNWVTGYPFTTLTAIKANYTSVALYPFTPYLAKEYTGINFTMFNTTTVSSDTKIRGTVRSNVGAHSPVINATVSISNVSHGGAFSTTVQTNGAGAYSVGSLLFGGQYDVFSSANGFYNSPTSVVTAGV